MSDRARDTEARFDDCCVALGRVERRRCLVDLLDGDDRHIDAAWSRQPTD